MYNLNCITTVLPTSAILQRAQTPLASIKPGSGLSLQPESLSTQSWAPGYVRGCELCLPCHLLISKQLLSFFSMKNLVHVLCLYSTFSSKVTNDPKQQRRSVTEKRTGALRQRWSDATLDDILMYVTPPL